MIIFIMKINALVSPIILPTAGGILGPQVEIGLALVRRVISLVFRNIEGPTNNDTYKQTNA